MMVDVALIMLVESFFGKILSTFCSQTAGPCKSVHGGFNASECTKFESTLLQTVFKAH